MKAEELMKHFPPGFYRIRLGAPYGVSCAGTIVYTLGYNADGSISVLVRSLNKLPAGLAHERELGRKFEKSKEEMAKIHAADVAVDIDPVWMERLPEEKFDRFVGQEEAEALKLALTDYHMRYEERPHGDGVIITIYYQMPEQLVHIGGQVAKRMMDNPVKKRK